MGKARRFLGLNNIKNRGEQQGQNRGINTFNLYQSNPTSPKRVSKTTEFLRTTGGVLSGPDGTIANTITIDTGKLNIASKTGAALDPIKMRKRTFVDPEGAVATDTLDMIDADGLEIPGQELILMGNASGNTVTITHNSGSASGNNRAILCPGAADFTLSGTNTVTLIYDEVATKWVLIGSSSKQIADSDTKVVCTDATPDIQFQINGVTAAAFNLDGSSIERLLMNVGTYLDMNAETIANVDVITPDAGVIRIVDESVVHSLTGFMGFSVSSSAPTMSASTNVGAILGPYKASTDSSPSSSTLNDWFGEFNGCFGFQYDSGGATTALKYRIWVKMNDGWHNFGAVA